MADQEDWSSESYSGLPNIFDLARMETRAKHLKMLEDVEQTPERLAFRVSMFAVMNKPSK